MHFNWKQNCISKSKAWAIKLKSPRWPRLSFKKRTDVASFMRTEYKDEVLMSPVRQKHSVYTYYVTVSETDYSKWALSYIFIYLNHFLRHFYGSGLLAPLSFYKEQCQLCYLEICSTSIYFYFLLFLRPVII